MAKQCIWFLFEEVLAKEPVVEEVVIEKTVSSGPIPITRIDDDVSDPEEIDISDPLQTVFASSSSTPSDFLMQSEGLFSPDIISMARRMQRPQDGDQDNDSMQIKSSGMDISVQADEVSSERSALVFQGLHILASLAFVWALLNGFNVNVSCIFFF